jgi:hypothetical protein
MKLKYSPVLVLLIVLTVMALPQFIVRAAGGRIEGKITDAKGAAIVGATVTVSDPANNLTQTATTDGQGNFKIEGLAPGTYTVVVSAKGFGDGRLETVKVDEGAAAPITMKLEVAALEAEVVVSAGGPKPNSDPVYQQLRQIGKGLRPADSVGAATAPESAGNYATVNNLILQRDAATFTLKSGEIYFLTQIEGRYIAAVFIGEGVLTLVPPTETEKRSLQVFTDEPGLTEEFSHLVLRFTDRTFEDVKNSPNAKLGSAGPQADRARELYKDNEQLLKHTLRDNRDLRSLQDIYCTGCPGFFNAFIDGKKHSKLVYLLDPLGVPNVSPEEVLLRSYGQTDGGLWSAFHLAEEYRNGTASSAQDHRLVDLTQHDIEATIKGAHLAATDRITFRALISGIRVLPLDLFPTLRVSRVVDEQGHDLNLIQENKDEDADFGIIFPQALEAGKTYKVTITYGGADAIRDSGGGNFILIPRSTWYPNQAGTQFGDRAIFNMTFHFPKGFTLVGTGALASPETRDGDGVTAKWTSGTTELAVAGFNYGKFKKKELADKDSGYNIEFYANTEVPDAVRQMQIRIEQAEARGEKTDTTLGSISTTGMADQAIADAQNSVRIYNNYFGKLPYTRMAMTQQPAAGFGQAWPTLIFMPYTAFMDSTQRTQMMGIRGGTDTFWKYVAPHEIAHQWWGHIIGWDSYHDQWMSEGFAEFSASLYVQITRGNDKFVEFWEDQRKLITEASPQTRGRKPYTVGAVTQGYRLNNAKTGGVARRMIYPKGAYILHMLRMLMYDPAKGGDARFIAMMKDLIQTHFNKDISTEDLKQIVEKHITKEMDLDGNKKLDWFFDEWVYGMEMPAYRFEYQLNGDALSGKIIQSNVTDKFVMRVPVYVDFGKGWQRIGAATVSGNSSVDLNNVKLPKGAKRASICALNDVLASSIQNSK